jgi:hypothetical protein
MPNVPTGTTGTVVEEFMIGNTKIKICNDAYINRSPEEIEQTLKRINAKCLNFIMSDKYKPAHDEMPNPCAGERGARGSPSKK